MDRLQAMAVFRAVVDEGSFARAARVTSVSPASASRIVADLEKHLGTRLLHRTTRSLHPTEEGRAYHERCVAILDEIAETEEALRSRDVPSGTLRVTASPAFGALALAPVLPAFTRRFPRVRVDLFLDDRLVDVVREGYDVALRLVLGELPDSSLVARKVVSYRNVLVASPAYLAERGTPRVPADLEDHDVLMWSRRSTPEPLVLGGADGPVRVRVDGPIRTDGSLVQRSAALAGLGIADVPEYVVRQDLDSGALVAVLAVHEGRPLDLWIVHPPAGTLAARVRAFVDYVVAALGRP